MFFKKQRPGNSRPESSVDLRGAQLHWANELSSKKNVFKVRHEEKRPRHAAPLEYADSSVRTSATLRIKHVQDEATRHVEPVCVSEWSLSTRTRVAHSEEEEVRLILQSNVSDEI